MECYNNNQSLSQRHDLTPIIYLYAKSIQGIPLEKPLVALCDSGATTTMINKESFPFGVQPMKGPPKRAMTTNGTFNTSEMVIIHSIKFPEFGNTTIPDLHADVFHSKGCRYDIILGRTELQKMRITFDFQKSTISWFEQTISMKATKSL